MTRLYLYAAALLALAGALTYAHHRVYQSGYQARQSEEAKAQAEQLAKDAAAVPALRQQAQKRATTTVQIIERAKRELPPTACFNTAVTADDVARLLDTGTGDAARPTTHGILSFP